MSRWKEAATLCCLAGLVCSFTTESNPLDQAKKVAQLKMAGNDQLIAVDYSAFPSKEITLPLSFFTEEMQIVKLDGREEALVGNSAVTISENYILVSNHLQNPCKLFDRQGKFLTVVGAVGEGPGEYQNIYHAAIDEKDGLIYLVGWDARHVLVYDLKGKFKKALPMLEMNLKGVCWPDPATSAVSVAVMANRQSPAVAYTLQPDGKPTGVVKPGPLAVPAQSYNYEILSFKNTPAMDLHVYRFFGRRPDTLYHYDAARGVVHPRFTIDFSQQTPIHTYTELPNYFIGDVSIEKKESEVAVTTQETRFYIVDKKTLKGSFFKLVNDYLGNMEVELPSYAFKNGYYVAIFDPGALEDMLDKFLASRSDLPKAVKAKLTALRDSIDENDNNYIFYAKLKE